MVPYNKPAIGKVKKKAGVQINEEKASDRKKSANRISMKKSIPIAANTMTHGDKKKKNDMCVIGTSPSPIVLSMERIHHHIIGVLRSGYQKEIVIHTRVFSRM